MKEFQPEGSPEVWLFRKNLAPPVPAGDPSYRFIAFLTFRYLPKGIDGLPTTDDEAKFVEFEENYLPELEKNLLAIYVGAVTKNGIKDFLFYIRDPDEFQRRAAPLKAAYAQFRVEFEVLPDPQWEQYAEFP